MKGIILAGGSGSRLSPVTNVVSKQILPVYDKPMIYYPLSNLMNIGIRDILIISTPRDTPRIKDLLGDGSGLGIKLNYEIQEKPNGIAEAFIIAENFIGDSSVSLILGDNIFYGTEVSGDVISDKIIRAKQLKEGAAVMAYKVSDPKRYGVVEFDDNDVAISIEEKPENPKSNWAITGWYFYDNNVIKIAKNLRPSARGELEITDINSEYLKQGNLTVVKMGRGFAWLDAGTHQSLYNATQFVEVIEERQGIKIACIEEIAYYKNYIDLSALKTFANSYKKGNTYGDYLKKLVKIEESYL